MQNSTPILRRRATATLVVTSLVLHWIAVSGVPPAAAAVGPQSQSSVVSAVPAGFTPNITDGMVKSIVQVGNRMIVAGQFSTVKQCPPGRVKPCSPSVMVSSTRNNLFAFNATTGDLDEGFRPVVDAEVDSVIPSTDNASVYIGGWFTNVNGVRSKSLERISVTTGASIAGFNAPALNGIVTDLKLSNGRLFLAGSFTVANGIAHAGLATVNPSTGAVDPFVNLQVAGHHNYTPTNGAIEGAVGVWKFDIAPNGRRLVAVGNFTSVSGFSRDQIVMVDLTGTTARVNSDWATPAYTPDCFSWKFDGYMRGIQFSPDGGYFVVVTSGGYFGGSFAACDTAARFETASTGANVAPTWVDQTGADTLLSVAVTGTAVYVGGHQRWMNNPYGEDHAAAGAVPRPGIAALDPVNGLPVAWNPGRPRGVGAEALLATPTGLWMGSDTSWVGNFEYYRDRIAFFPLAGGATLPPPNTGPLPGKVVFAGRLSSTAAADNISTRTYDGGAGVGANTPISNGGTAWGQARGGVMINGTLFYGWSDGNLYRRSFNGTTFGAPVLVDPYNDPKWSTVPDGSVKGQTLRGVKPSFYSQLPYVTGMFFSGGRLYYTIVGDSTLRSRPFTPDSGIVGPREETADTTINWADAGGMFLANGRLYWVTRAGGSLHRVNFSAGHPTASTATVVSGPATDGVDWRARALFLDSHGAPK